MVKVEDFPWGKYREASGQTHRLEHHCADVAACFEALLRDPVLRSRFDKAAGNGGLDRVTEARLTVLAFFHDFGKLNAGFQFKIGKRWPGAPPKAGHIKEALWAFGHPDVCDALGFPGLVESWGPIGLEQVLLAALAHHGRPAPEPTSGSGPVQLWRTFGEYDPVNAATTFRYQSRRWFPEAFAAGPKLPKSPALTHLFAGVLAIADQIGSNEEFFPFVPELDPGYMDQARNLARDAVRKLGFRRSDWIARAPDTDFQTLFGHQCPRPLQTVVAEAPLDRPLLILESETGSGKTEAAVMRFAALWRAGLVDGLYFALPTRAAAGQLHTRVNVAMKRLFPVEAGLETVLAVPGYLKAGDARGWRVGKFEVRWADDPLDAKHLARWSAESARKFLSATAAVGTVDQALLSGLAVKWTHFRGSALARSLLVVDEVHASDAYMTEILRAVLGGHLDIGGHALLMSATLGSEARDILTYRGSRRGRETTLTEAKAVPYPALTLADGQRRHEIESFADTGYSKQVAMAAESILGNPARIAALALDEARKGAKVLVVRNTVKQAQAVFAEVLGLGGEYLSLQAGGGPALHHSRFAVEDRELLDEAVEKALSKGQGSGARIVIGTQTLEQSLDIDADLLVSDLCPVDVLLQRIGRLHRHEKMQRPAGFADPRCIVLVPENGLEAGLDGGLLRYGLGMSKDGGIYRDLRVLELTRRLVTRQRDWVIPETNRTLVEEGTHPERLRALEKELGAAWQEQSQENDGRTAAERQVARGHVINRSQEFAEIVFPDLGEVVRTRLGEDGPRIKLSTPIVGPFGREITTFNLPAHFFRGADGMPSKTEIEDARAEPTPNGVILRVGSRAFPYDRAGVHRESG